MQKIYINGLVKVADTVRRSLAVPRSSEQEAKLRKLVADSLAQVNDILVANGATAKQLPAPSRRAYDFLASVDLDRTPTAPHDEHAPSSHGAVTMPGLTSIWEQVLHTLARPLDNAHADSLRESIITTSENLRRQLNDHQIRTENLKRPSRQAYAWLRYFAIPDNFNAYVSTVRVAHPILREAMSGQPKCHSKLLLEFRPMSGLYRVRAAHHGTRVALPTPMISFTEAQFRGLAAALFGNASKELIIKAAQDEPYQAMQAEIDALEGVVEHTAGVHHDLARSFDRVALRYFNGELSRPRLTWNRTLTGRKFGHYDPITNTVMVSCTLDDAEVGEFVVDFVMYHELLHKKLGADWGNGRQAVHTAEFRQQEKLFEQYAAAEATLNAIARRHA
jgi:hypothetical protein